MTNGDHALLDAIIAALNAAPFAPTITVHGCTLSRPVARAFERQLLRLRMDERRAA